MSIAEIKQKLIAAADDNPELISKIEAVVSAGGENLEAKLIALASANPALATAVQIVLPAAKTVASDILKSRGPVKMQSEGEIKIIFED